MNLENINQARELLRKQILLNTEGRMEENSMEQRQIELIREKVISIDGTSYIVPENWSFDDLYKSISAKGIHLNSVEIFKGKEVKH